MGLKFENENEFNKLLHGLKKYCPTAYKDIIFNLKGKITSNLLDGIYSQNIQTAEDFRRIYGQIRVIYEIKNNQIILKRIEPTDILLDMHRKLISTYKGFACRDDKDKFKINLFLKMAGN